MSNMSFVYTHKYNYLKEIDDGRAEALKNMYVGLVMKSRQLYLDYHESHPGFFVLVVKKIYIFSFVYIKILIKNNTILYNIVIICSSYSWTIIQKLSIR